MKPKKLKRIRLTVYVLPKVVQYIDHLSRSELYGNGSCSQAIERLLSEAIFSKATHPIFKEKFLRINPQLCNVKK